jgi:hypothetical protein
LGSNCGDVRLGHSRMPHANLTLVGTWNRITGSTRYEIALE